MVQALGQPRYIPQGSTNALKQIVDDHLEELKSVYDERFARSHGPLTPRVLDLFERFVRCANPHFGFLRLRCSVNSRQACMKSREAGVIVGVAAETARRSADEVETNERKFHAASADAAAV
jgi:hypothetical protein